MVHGTWARPIIALAAPALVLASISTATPSGAASPESSRVCGGELAPDKTFKAEKASLGSEHACEHLQGRWASKQLRATMPQHEHGTTAVDGTARAAGTPAQVGSWSAAKNPGTKTVGISSVLFHTGEVLLFGGKYASTDKNTASFLYDPVTGTGHEVPAPAAVYCGSVAQLADGRMLSAGGADPVPKGTVELWIFDPISEKWTRQPDTPLGRYYPTSTKLADGRIVISSGNQLNGTTKNPTTEVFTPPAPGTSMGTLTKVGQDHPVNFYPHQWLMPDGKVFQVEARRTSVLDPATWRWNALPQLASPVGQGSSSLLYNDAASGDPQVMVAGGTVQGVGQRRSFLFDYGSVGSPWKAGTPIPEPRGHMNLVTTPDGMAYGIGGNSTKLYEVGQHETLSYNPDTKRWTPMATQDPRRAYHSTAILLPDGRIMSAGDTGPGGGRSLIDYYSPPYLFMGPRPAIESAPNSAGYGDTINVSTSGPSATKAVLMSPAATTHAVEMNARRVELNVTQTAGGLTAVVPGAKIAPPGYYMLFVLTPEGVPSKATWIHIGS